VTLIVDPEGNERQVEGVRYAGPAAAAEGTPDPASAEAPDIEAEPGLH
jgi:hypothetical protein